MTVNGVGGCPLCLRNSSGTIGSVANRRTRTVCVREVHVIRKLLPAIGAVAAVFALTVSAPAQEVKLTFADQNSPTGWGPAHATYPWVKQIEEAGKGRIKIEVF